MNHTAAVVIGFDFGSKKTGIAIGQSLTQSAQSLTTLPTIKQLPDLNALDKIIAEWQPQLAVIGLPPQANEAFRDKLNRLAATLKERYKLPSEFIDETLTSEHASHELYERGQKTRRKAAQRDQVAARLILETYFRG